MLKRGNPVLPVRGIGFDQHLSLVDHLSFHNVNIGYLGCLNIGNEAGLTVTPELPVPVTVTEILPRCTVIIWLLVAGFEFAPRVQPADSNTIPHKTTIKALVFKDIDFNFILV